MRRRITRAIVGVTAAVLVVLIVGLVIVARRDIVNREEVELQSEVARTLTEIDTPLDPTQLRTISAESDSAYTRDRWFNAPETDVYFARLTTH